MVNLRLSTPVNFARHFAGLPLSAPFRPLTMPFVCRFPAGNPGEHGDEHGDQACLDIKHLAPIPIRRIVLLQVNAPLSGSLLLIQYGRQI